MIKANELRIGNLIYNPVQKINFQADIQAISNVWYNYTRIQDLHYQPIPLTEELLKKCGFKWINHALRKENISIRYLSKNYEIFISNEKRRFVIQLKYVHQLQNLYFALTGEELEIKL